MNLLNINIMDIIKEIKIEQEIKINKIDGLLRILFKQIVRINEMVIFDKIRIVDIINLV